jgi:hypothetical protein
MGIEPNSHPAGITDVRAVIRVRARMLVAVLVVVTAGLLAVTSAAEAMECTDTWTGGSSGLWQESANWSTGEVPESSSVACIGSGSTATVSSGEQEVGTVRGDGTLRTTGGTLKIVGASVSKIAILILGGGAMEVAGVLKVSSALEGTGTTLLYGAGQLDITSGAAGSIAGSATLRMSAITIKSYGMFSVAEGADLTGSGGAKFVNDGTLIVNGELGRHGEEGAELVNNKTLEKTEGSGHAVVEFAVDNEGTVSTTAGVLEFVEGGGTSGVSHTSVWKAEGAGTAIEFDNAAYDLGAAPEVFGALEVSGAHGNVEAGRFNGEVTSVSLQGRAVLRVGGTLPLETLTLGGGSLYADDVSIAGDSVLTGGGTVSVGELVLGPKTWIGTGSSFSETLSGDVVNGPGDVVVWEGGGLVGAGVYFENDGTFDVNALNPIENPAGMSPLGSAVFINSGTISSTGGSASIGWSVANYGSLPGELEGVDCVVVEPETPPTPSRGYYAFGVAGNLVFTPAEDTLFPPNIEPGPDGWKCEVVV